MSPREWDYLMAVARAVARRRGERVRVYAIRGRGWTYVIECPTWAAWRRAATSQVSRDVPPAPETVDQRHAEWLALFETGQPAQ